MEILRHDVFRVTRDADFKVSDEADDLLRAVEDELRRGASARWCGSEVGSNMDPDLRQYLIEQLRSRRPRSWTWRGCSPWTTCGSLRDGRAPRAAR